MAGGFLAGFLGDTLFRKKFKFFLIGILSTMTTFSFLVAISFPSIFSMNPLIKIPPAAIIFGIVFIGFLTGATIPLYFELAAEIGYPTMVKKNKIIELKKKKI
jgi:MFS family permease